MQNLPILPEFIFQNFIGDISVFQGPRFLITRSREDAEFVLNDQLFGSGASEGRETVRSIGFSSIDEYWRAHGADFRRSVDFDRRGEAFEVFGTAFFGLSETMALSDAEIETAMQNSMEEIPKLQEQISAISKQREQVKTDIESLERKRAGAWVNFKAAFGFRTDLENVKRQEAEKRKELEQDEPVNIAELSQNKLYTHEFRLSMNERRRDFLKRRRDILGTEIHSISHLGPETFNCRDYDSRPGQFTNSVLIGSKDNCYRVFDWILGSKPDKILELYRDLYMSSSIKGTNTSVDICPPYGADRMKECKEKYNLFSQVRKVSLHDGRTGTTKLITNR